MRTRRLYSVAKCLGAASTILLFADSVRAAPTMRPCWRNLTPEAQNRLAEYRQLGKDWRGHVDHTKLLVRGQFFYGLEKTYYIHNFYERPLMQDSSISAQNEHGHMLNPEGWRRTVQVARDMNLDGFAFFPTNPGCWDLLPRSTMSGSEIPILAEFHSGDRALGVQHCAEVAGRILSSPNAFKVGGKVVMTCYPAASWTDNAALDIWPDVKRELEKRYGKDKFALMPYMRVFDYSDLDGGVMTDAILERTREHLREILRKTDGERRPCVGYQCNGAVLLVGVKSDALAFFKGRIAALDVHPWGKGEDRP